MPTEDRADYFDQDNTDDQESTIREAESGPNENPDYPPAVVPKSVFMGKDIEVDGVYPMRVTAIHDDSVSIVCEGEAEEETPEPAGVTSTESSGAPTSDFD